MTKIFTALATAGLIGSAALLAQPAAATQQAGVHRAAPALTQASSQRRYRGRVVVRRRGPVVVRRSYGWRYGRPYYYRPYGYYRPYPYYYYGPPAPWPFFWPFFW